MDYQKIYNDLIEKGKNRNLEGYSENHHIVPKCLGGSDVSENLVRLTPEEHYVAHQLLVKIYPENQQLINAALMMTVSSKTVVRNNKRYGWLKRKYLSVCKQRIGEKNGAFGSFWITNGIENRKIKNEEIPEGWQRGRFLQKTKKNYMIVCKNCDVVFDSNDENRIFCCRICSAMSNIKSADLTKVRKKKLKISYCKNCLEKMTYFGKEHFYCSNVCKEIALKMRRKEALVKANKIIRKRTNDEIRECLIKNDLNIDLSLVELGYKANQSGYTRYRFIDIKKEIEIANLN